MTNINNTIINKWMQSTEQRNILWLQLHFINYIRCNSTISSNVAFISNTDSKENTGKYQRSLGQSLYFRYISMDSAAQNDVISRWIIERSDYAASKEYLVFDSMTWEEGRTSNTKWEHHGQHAKTRRYVFLSIANFFRDMQKADRTRKRLEREATTCWLEAVTDTNIDNPQERHMNAKKILTELMEQLTEEENYIVLWRIGMLDIDGVCKATKSSKATIFRKFNAFKLKYRGAV